MKEHWLSTTSDMSSKSSSKSHVAQAANPEQVAGTSAVGNGPFENSLVDLESVVVP